MTPYNDIILPEKETDEIINLFGSEAEIERQTWKAAEKLAAFAAAVKALTPIFKELVERLQPLLKTIGDVIDKQINLYPNKRVIYLAKHGKRRTRKKNINRIIKYFEREAKKRPVFRTE